MLTSMGRDDPRPILLASFAHLRLQPPDLTELHVPFVPTRTAPDARKHWRLGKPGIRARPIPSWSNRYSLSGRGTCRRRPRRRARLPERSRTPSAALVLPHMPGNKFLGKSTRERWSRPGLCSRFIGSPLAMLWIKRQWNC